MSDTEGFEFEAATERDIEVVTLGDGEEAPSAEVVVEEGPKKVEMTAEEYQQLLSKNDATVAMRQGIEALGEKLGRPVNAPQQAVVDDWDPAKLEEEAWKPGKFTDVVNKITQRAVGQMAGQTAVALQAQSKRILGLDPKTSEYYQQFEGEIEKRVQGLPPNVRYMPDIYERVYRDVVADNQSVLIEQKAAKIAEKAVEEALKKAGVGQNKGTGGVYSESNPQLRPVTTQKVYLTRADVMDMEGSGMDPRDTDSVRAYLDWKKSKNKGGK